jgi:hypothetical protein
MLIKLTHGRGLKEGEKKGMGKSFFLFWPFFGDQNDSTDLSLYRIGLGSVLH